MKNLSEIRALGFTDEEIKRHMSPMILGIARATNLETALQFANEFSSLQIYLPGSPDRWGFTAVVGLDGAAKIIEHIGGNRYIEVPAAFGARNVTRLKGIAMLRTGKKTNDVCRELGVARTTVKSWRRDFVEIAR